jgi:quinol-cytochrome oxidoreductase complex cytochrome b subunit
MWFELALIVGAVVIALLTLWLWQWLDESSEPYPSWDASGTIKAFLAAAAVAVSVVAGAAIVEAVAVSSFGLLAGTVIAVLVAMVMGIGCLALRSA